MCVASATLTSCSLLNSVTNQLCRSLSILSVSGFFATTALLDCFPGHFSNQAETKGRARARLDTRRDGIIFNVLRRCRQCRIYKRMGSLLGSTRLRPQMPPQHCLTSPLLDEAAQCREMLIKISAVATGASECTDGESARILACLHWVLTEKRVVAVNTCVKSNNCQRKGLNLRLNWNIKCCAMHGCMRQMHMHRSQFWRKDLFIFPDHQPWPPHLRASATSCNGTSSWK